MRRLVIAIMVFACTGRAVETSKVSFPAPQGMTQADVWFADTAKNPKGVLVLCPGMNGSGEPLVADPQWQSFASRNHLALAGLSFSSPPAQLYAGFGYTFPDQGSGEILLSAVRKQYGRDLPLLLYGFSSGAYFTELFVNWRPDSVIAWCAHATGRYEESPRCWPPGIVSCGELDGTRLGAALTHFKRGRVAGSSLLWVEVNGAGHQWTEKLNSFVRDYFSAILNRSGNGIWIDVENGEKLTENIAAKQPSLSAWLPSKDLLQKWIGLSSQ
ncbi:MAG: hypothetical protein WC765_01835 [Phycisphaerae bacterium]|jgi:hypothetical protein